MLTILGPLYLPVLPLLQAGGPPNLSLTSKSETYSNKVMLAVAEVLVMVVVAVKLALLDRSLAINNSHNQNNRNIYTL